MPRLSDAVAKALDDPRRRASFTHDLRSLLRQRLHGLALGYEDLNDHHSLRRDLALQTAVERDTPLASAATLCHWENRADRAAAWWLHEVLLEQFILEAIRRLALAGTELANAYVGTIRLKLLKIGAVITRNIRHIRFLLSSAYPYQRLFADVAAKLHPT